MHIIFIDKMLIYGKHGIKKQNRTKVTEEEKNSLMEIFGILV